MIISGLSEIDPRGLKNMTFISKRRHTLEQLQFSNIAVIVKQLLVFAGHRKVYRIWNGIMGLKIAAKRMRSQYEATIQK